MFSFLNLTFESFESIGKGLEQNETKKQSRQWLWESTNSPLFSTKTTTGTPRTEPVVTPPPTKTPLESPEARDGEVCPLEKVKKRQSVRSRRRSSVFFKLPDLEKVLRKGGEADVNPLPPSPPAQLQPKPNPERIAAERRREKEDGGHSNHDVRQDFHHRGAGVGEVGQNLASKFSRQGGSSRRRSRRASIAPEFCPPSRRRSVDRAREEVAAVATGKGAIARQRQDLGDDRSRGLEIDLSLVGADAVAAAVAEATAAAEESIPCFENMRSDGGTMLVTVGEDGPTGSPADDVSLEQDSPRTRPPRKPSPLSSPRALSVGHRRESCRDGRIISHAPKGLSAARLLEDAHDVARIRSQANLRAKMEGVCWVASNWRVGGRKGVLSGKRFLVLCDNIVWAELREADRRASLGEGTGGARKQAAGFMPIIALEGAIVQHCEVANSNNGWVIEVVNPEEDVTLWLDPENPTALLRWGSVLCQALQQTLHDDDE